MRVALAASGVAVAGAFAWLVCASATAGGSIRRLNAAFKESDRLVAKEQQLVDVLFRVLYAARTTLAPCPACDRRLDEPCLCAARRQALAVAIEEAEQFPPID
jgi:hypothetical protein